ncbi:helix-turn-helix transcriptional regulator [Streptomyces sp. NPDC097619]|uniref:helix-turn-helix domain-containing protein n=1 Tax=Streptomyces sp. NPDC097619 TaxID=3157228 RepID=UPI00331DCF96
MVGSQLAVLRTRKNLTQRQLGHLVGLEAESIASIEQGRRALMTDVAERLDTILDTGGVLAAGVSQLPKVDSVPAWAEEYMRHEEEAVSLSWYDNQVIPGLLQSEGYARAVFRCRVPAYPAEKIEELTADRIARQELLHRNAPPTLSFVVWEPVVRHRIGGQDTHRELLRHLLACSELPDLTLQVLPLDQPFHAALDGPFTLLETPHHQYLGYSEGQRGSRLITAAEEVSILARRYAMLRTHALDTVQTQGLLHRLLGEP